MSSEIVFTAVIGILLLGRPHNHTLLDGGAY